MSCHKSFNKIFMIALNWLNGFGGFEKCVLMDMLFMYWKKLTNMEHVPNGSKNLIRIIMEKKVSSSRHRKDNKREYLRQSLENGPKLYL
jgi:hypothetical protein